MCLDCSFTAPRHSDQGLALDGTSMRGSDNSHALSGAGAGSPLPVPDPVTSDHRAQYLPVLNCLGSQRFPGVCQYSRLPWPSRTFNHEMFPPPDWPFEVPTCVAKQPHKFNSNPSIAQLHRPKLCPRPRRVSYPR